MIIIIVMFPMMTIKVSTLMMMAVITVQNSGVKESGLPPWRRVRHGHPLGLVMETGGADTDETVVR